MINHSSNTHTSSFKGQSEYSYDPSNKSSSRKLAKSGKEESMGDCKVESMEDEIEDKYDPGELDFTNNARINSKYQNYKTGQKIYQTEAEKVPPKPAVNKISETHKIEKRQKWNYHIKFIIKGSLILWP